MCLYRTSQEAWEWANLAPFATKSDDRKFSWRYTNEGKLDNIARRFPLPKTNDPIDQSGSKSRYKTSFQIDKERIMESQAFRRLEYKTQIFVSHEGDHYRTRLTHTLEVAAIARTIANALKLNEDLCEAIALAHDLGHTPFGHCGAMVLGELFKEKFATTYHEDYLGKQIEYGGTFYHNVQGIKVVDLLELGYGWDMRERAPMDTILSQPDHRKFFSVGLDLTLAVREGILKHDLSGMLKNNRSGWFLFERDSSKYKEQMLGSGYLLKELQAEKAGTLESQVVERADKIAFLVHDLEDGIRSSLIKKDNLIHFVKTNIKEEQLKTMLGLTEEFGHVSNGEEIEVRVQKFRDTYNDIVNNKNISTGNILSFIKGLLISNIIENSFFKIFSYLESSKFREHSDLQKLKQKKIDTNKQYEYEIKIDSDKKTTLVVFTNDTTSKIVTTGAYSIKWVHKSENPKDCQNVKIEYITNNNLVTGEIPLKSIQIYFDLSIRKRLIDFSEDVNVSIIENAKKLIRKNIHRSSRVNKLNEKGKYFISKVFERYYQNPLQMHRKALERGGFLDAALDDKKHLQKKEDFILRLVEHIQGMTDRFISNEYSKLFIPNVNIDDDESSEITINE